MPLLFIKHVDALLVRSSVWVGYVCPMLEHNKLLSDIQTRDRHDWNYVPRRFTVGQQRFLFCCGHAIITASVVLIVVYGQLLRDVTYVGSNVFVMLSRSSKSTYLFLTRQTANFSAYLPVVYYSPRGYFDHPIWSHTLTHTFKFLCPDGLFFLNSEVTTSRKFTSVENADRLCVDLNIGRATTAQLRLRWPRNVERIEFSL